LRLHAEYLWYRQQSGRAKYHFTSGDRSTWADWRRGERFKIHGNQVKRVSGARRAATHKNYRAWLTHLFRYAGTRSLRYDSDPVSQGDVQPGDIFVQPGSPGHAIVILDVAIDSKARKRVLLGQGFMPAEEFHVLKAGYNAQNDDVWFRFPDSADGRLQTPSWPAPFKWAHLRRFR